jgi:hypothetical protein
MREGMNAARVTVIARNEATVKWQVADYLYPQRLLRSSQ